MTATTPANPAKPPVQQNRKIRRFGMVINLDACTGCGACMMACAVENNCAPAKDKITDRTGITLMRVFPVNDRQPMPARQSGFVPMPCMQCEIPPCERSARSRPSNSTSCPASWTRCRSAASAAGIAWRPARTMRATSTGPTPNGPPEWSKP
jgi:Fe-S-cluster-containing dehydrogenase component